MATKEEKEKCKIWFKSLKKGKKIYNTKQKQTNEILNLTNTSVELYHKKITKKGIDYTQWYDIDRLADITKDYAN